MTSGCASRVSRRGVTTDRKSTRLNSSHLVISYAVFCLKKKNEDGRPAPRPTVLWTAAVLGTGAHPVGDLLPLADAERIAEIDVVTFCSAYIGAVNATTS